MHISSDQPPGHAPDADPAARQLHIYYLKGRAKNCEAVFPSGFIGNWEEADCSFLFFSISADQHVRRFVDADPGLSWQDTFVMPYAQWQPTDAFPLQAGGFVIYPPWQAPPPDQTATPLLLDPGVVFGSGLHETTFHCLEALEVLCYKAIPKIATAVDLGTGTGLLAIAAARRGIANIIALDLNFLAAQTARKNVVGNQVEKQVLVVKGKAEQLLHKPVDLFMANIHYDIMQQLIDSAAFINSKYFILSGLLRTPARQVSRQLEKMPVKIIKSWNYDNIWYTFLGETKFAA